MITPVYVQLAKSRGHLVFGRPWDANLIVLRGPVDQAWDGWLSLSWTEDDGLWRLIEVPCATRPGIYYLKHPMNPKGTATIEPGQHRLSHARGMHHAGTPKASDAFVQVGLVPVKRDNNGNVEHDPPPEIHGDASGVNIHRITNPDFLAGCIGVQAGHLDRVLAAYDRLHAHRPQPRVSLTLIVG